MDYWAWLDMTVPGWLALLGSMCLGAFLYAAGYREGLRPAAKPVDSPWPEMTGFEGVGAMEEGGLH